MTSAPPTPSPLLSHRGTTEGVSSSLSHELQVRRSPSESKTRGAGEGEELPVEEPPYPEPRGLAASKPARLKRKRWNHLPVRGGLGNTVQQPTEWTEEATAISSQSDAGKEETQALEVSAVRRGRPEQESCPTAFPGWLQGCRFWGKEWKRQTLKKPQCSRKSITTSAACSRLENPPPQPL